MKRMYALILALIIFATCAVTAFADGENFDITVDTTKVEELGVPTKKSVATMKATADGYWEAKDYANAAPAYAIYAKNANWLANIIAAIDEPYYSATSKKRDNFYYSSMFSTASSAESSANSYKEQRNQAMAREAMCYYYLGDYNSAIPLLIKALDLIDIEDTTNWKMCADAINDIISK